MFTNTTGFSGLVGNNVRNGATIRDDAETDGHAMVRVCEADGGADQSLGDWQPCSSHSSSERSQLHLLRLYLGTLEGLPGQVSHVHWS